jgi:hypothetical protein
MTRNRWCLLTSRACLCLALVTGCGGDKDKGTFSNLDRPQLPAKK